MRILVAALAIVMVFGATAWAAAGDKAPAKAAGATASGKSAYDDVPTDHWAYNALDYLTERGVLEGYPGGFFKGDRTLTRYEFAQAIARLLDTIQQGNPPEDIKVMVDSLRAEFSDQLSDQKKSIDKLTGDVTDQGSRIVAMESSVSDQGNRLGALEDKVKNMKSGPDWKGSFRYRWRIDRQDPADIVRFRQQIAFKLGYAKQINDYVQVGFRFATATGTNNGTAANFTLGGPAGPFNTPPVFLDQAYVKYTPHWFGYYTTPGCDSKCSPKIELWAGIVPDLMHDPNEMVLDKDINIHGMSFVYHFNKDFQMTGIAGAVVEKATASDKGLFLQTPGNGDDTYLYGVELAHNNIFICGLDAWVGIYVWHNETGLDVPYGTGPGGDPFWDNGFVHTAPAFAPGGTAGTTQRLTAPFSNNFSTVKGGAQYTFREVFNRPFAVYGEYMVNLGANNPGVAAGAPLRFAPGTVIPLLAAADNIGWLVGAQWGPVPTEPGQWYWFARYREVGSDVIIDGFGDSDTGGANVNSLEVSAATMVYKDSMFGISYFLNRMHNAYGYSIPPGRGDTQTVFVDWTFKF